MGEAIVSRVVSVWPTGRSSLASLALALLITALAGLLHGSSWVFPGWWIGAWLGQALLIILAVLYRPAAAMGLGFLVGFLGNGWAFAWAPECLTLCFDAPPWLARSLFGLLVGWEGMQFALYCGLVSWAVRRSRHGIWLTPFAWVSLERLWPRIFPWLIGYSQLELLPLLQIAEITGSTGVSFCLVAVSAIPAAWLLRHFHRDGRQPRTAWSYSLAAMILLLTVVGFGLLRLAQWDRKLARADKMRIALIQVDPMRVGSEAKLRQRTLAVHGRVDLVCWPESAIGNYSNELKDFTDIDRTRKWSRHSRESLQPAAGLQCDLLAGGKTYPPDAPEEGPYTMTAFLINPGQQIIGQYHKRTLLPFGEYMPGQERFPQLREWATLDEIVRPGTDARPLLNSRGDRLGVVICYEDLLPGNVRDTVTSGAEVLISIINGTAFDNPLTLEQHRRLAQMRSVENRRYLVRCASTGVSCIVAPTGQVLGELEIGTEGTLEGEIALLNTRSFYSRWGEWFSTACLLLVTVCLLTAVMKRRAKSEPRPSRPNGFDL